MTKDFRNILSARALARKPSPIRAITSHLLSLPPDADVLSMAGGIPCPKTFPFKEINVTLDGGKSLEIKGSALKRALNYGKSVGDPALIDWWGNLLKNTMDIPKDIERKCIVTTGSEQGNYMVLSNIINPGDGVLIPKPCYPPFLNKAMTLDAEVHEVEEDLVEGGICVDNLEMILESWQEDKRKPKVLIVCPTGSNPSGTSIPNHARPKIYELACKHDLVIIEDDPYYFLNFKDEKESSFLSLDIDGRVIRLDSLSKVLCPGFRLGFLTAPKHFGDILEYHIQEMTLHTCATAQVLALSYLENLGISGFLNFTSEVSRYYEEKRTATLAALEEHLSSLATWTTPKAGMFVWLTIHGIKDTSTLFQLGLDNGVAFLPGKTCMVDEVSPNIRISYSQLEIHEIDAAVSRLKTTIEKALTK